MNSLRLDSVQDAVVASHQVLKLAVAHGMSAKRAGELAIAVSELVSNAVLHGGGGQFDATIAVGQVVVTIVDRGSTLRHRGLGIGLDTSRRMVDRLELTRASGGWVVRAWKALQSRS